MGPPPITDEMLRRRYDTIYRERMKDLPLVNPSLRVDTVGFREYRGQQLGVLITPWFMNLIMLPRGRDWTDHAQGASHSIVLPRCPIEFTVSRDEELGVFLSAVLFGSVADFPDQETALEIAEETLRELFTEAETPRRAVSRRDFLAGLSAG